MNERIKERMNRYKADIHLVSRVERCEIEDVLRLLGTCEERLLSAVFNSSLFYIFIKS